MKTSKDDTLEFRISNLGAKLVRHHDEEERETDGVVHWKSIDPKLRDAFQRKPSLNQLASSICPKGAKKTGSNIARFPTTFCSIFALFQDTLEGT